jgi:hypothetical protein
MSYRLFAASLAASFALASPAMAATSGDTGRIASQYSSWAGSPANAEALVNGLRNGTAVTLVTHGAGNGRSIAGFTPAGPMSYGNVNSALRNAQRSLSRMGIANPSAEQIQAALIGGEVELANGKTRELRGTVAARGGNPQLASR